MRFLIIGAGMSGILSAIKLREAGHSDVVIYEKADRLGGTWRENTYPGIACDVPSHFYAYSFAPNPEWSHVFSPGAEIQAYFEGVARRYGVDALMRFGKEITRLEWRDERWHLTAGDGTTPLPYQAAYLDPTGRTVMLGFRKLFFSVPQRTRDAGRPAG